MENRKYFRFPCQCFGEVRFGSKGVQLSLIKNVSNGGLGLVIHGIQCCPDANVEVRIDIPEKKPPLLVTGKVKWSSPISHHIEVGIQFTDLDPLTKRDLLDYGFSTWCNEVRYKAADRSLQN